MFVCYRNDFFVNKTRKQTVLSMTISKEKTEYKNAIPKARKEQGISILLSHALDLIYLNSTVCPRSSDPFYIVTYYFLDI